MQMQAVLILKFKTAQRGEGANANASAAGGYGAGADGLDAATNLRLKLIKASEFTTVNNQYFCKVSVSISCRKKYCFSSCFDTI